MLYHIFATTEMDNPMIVIMGQTEYTNAGNARDGALTEIHSLLTNDLLLPETRPIATIIYQTRDTYTNPVQARIISTDAGDDFID